MGKLETGSRIDRHFWEANGYLIVHEAVPAQLVRAARDAVCEFQQVDLARPETWYRSQPANQMAELNRSGMVELYHHQALWDIRQHPKIHQVFAELWEEPRLWVTIDRVNFNPPARADWPFQGFIHWDVDTSVQPVPFGVQGVLSLTDTPPGRGGFQCVPGFPRQFESWLKTQPTDRDPWRPDLEGLEVKSIATRAGDLLIWHNALPHGTSANRGPQPRIAQYLCMFPAREKEQPLREQRIRLWRESRSPEGFAFPGNERERQGRTGPATLTALGRKLLGLDSWENE